VGILRLELSCNGFRSKIHYEVSEHESNASQKKVITAKPAGRWVAMAECHDQTRLCMNDPAGEGFVIDEATKASPVEAMSSQEGAETLRSDAAPIGQWPIQRRFVLVA